MRRPAREGDCAVFAGADHQHSVDPGNQLPPGTQPEYEL
jgi:hypothetical protein